MHLLTEKEGHPMQNQNKTTVEWVIDPTTEAGNNETRWLGDADKNEWAKFESQWMNLPSCPWSLNNMLHIPSSAAPNPIFGQVSTFYQGTYYNRNESNPEICNANMEDSADILIVRFNVIFDN